MMKTSTTEAKIRELLPWYVTGKLSEQEREDVKQALANDPGLAQELEHIRREQHDVAAAARATPIPSAAIWDKLAARLEAEATAEAAATTITEALPTKDAARQEGNSLHGNSLPGAGSFAAVTGALKAWLANLVKPLGPPAMPAYGQMAMLATALAIILLQAGIIGYLWLEQRRAEPLYQTASGGNSGGSDVTTSPDQRAKLLISFQPNATLNRISSLLRHIGAETVAGPKSSGFYIIRLDLPASDKAAIERRVQQLRSRPDLVRFVTPAFNPTPSETTASPDP